MFKFGERAIYQKNIKAAIAEARRNGFDVLEIHLSSPQFSPDLYSKKELLSLRVFAERQEVTLQIHASLEASLLFIDLRLRQAAKDYFKMIVRFGGAIGARCLTIHPGSVFGYHTAAGTRLKNDDVYRGGYARLFDDSLKFIASIAAKQRVLVCIENADNFNTDYQKILEKYLKRGNIYLTWDIRKTFFLDGSFRTEQWHFIKKNLAYVKNMHVSGLRGGHGAIGAAEKKLSKFFKLFPNHDIPLVIEILPLSAALASRNNLKKVISQ
jgi:sugar phosphate isomerase/epimerase